MDQHFPFEAIPLPFSYVALMPYCDANTLYFHHDQYYMQEVARLNQLVVHHRLTHLSLEELLTADINLPAAQLQRLLDAAGAVYNHQLFFDSTGATPSLPPRLPLTEQIQAIYGSLPRFLRLLTEAAISIPGSGWVWLLSEGGGDLHIATTSDNRVVNLRYVRPIFVIDLWEHAYLTTSRFNIPQYISTWFSLLDWNKANQRFVAAQRR